MGRLVLVTGGNRGIGYEICRKLVSSGSNVLLSSRDLKGGAAAADKIVQETGRKNGCRVVPLDVSSSDSIDNLVKMVESEYSQQITALINNAGILHKDWNQDLFDLVKKTNYEAPVELTRKLAPSLAEGAQVIMVSSGWGMLNEIPPNSAYLTALTSAKSTEDLDAFTFIPNDPIRHDRDCPTYKLTKAMLNKATQILAEDPIIKKKGISVNACCPGWCRTDMGGGAAYRSAGQGADSALWFLEQKVPPNGAFCRDGNPLSW